MSIMLKEFPDISWLKKQIATNFTNTEEPNGIKLTKPNWPTVILNVKTNSAHRPDVKGPLSIFTNISGRSEVDVGGRSVMLESDTYFLTNSGQEYSLDIQEKSETFNLHFGEEFIKDLSVDQDRLTNHIESDNRPGENLFFNRIAPRSAVMTSLIDQLYRANNAQESNLLLKEELLAALYLTMRRDQGEITKRLDSTSTIKKSTKVELFSRISMAVDYMYSYYDQDLSLDRLARMSCLSKYHFIRGFKDLYGKTPYQFLLDIRLQRSNEMLTNSDKSIGEIAQEVGFEYLPSFSRAYYKKYSHYPSAHRNRRIRNFG